jgi:uncharacterized FlaG/YvyC family protein
MNVITGTLPAVATPSNPALVSPEQAVQNRALIQATRAVNSAGTLGSNIEVTFQIDRTLRLPLIQIIDTSTNQVIDQIPPEYILQLAKTLGKDESNSVSFLG